MILVDRAFVLGEKEADLISLRNGKGMEVRLLNYGATLVDILMPDREGSSESIVLSYENVGDYIENKPYFGSTVGRVSGRIAGGTFVLDGKRHQLYKNFDKNHGHGGPGGFSFRFWDWKAVRNEDVTSVEFTYTSADIEENFPGRLDAKVVYTLTGDNRLTIEYEASSDRNTLCNLTNHTYFNLSGNYKRKVTEQKLRIASNRFPELDATLIPTGKLLEVVGTPMDFKQPKLIGRDIENNYYQLKLANGYDHAWLLDGDAGQIEMYDETSGRKMTVSTTYPSVVIYTYNYPNGEKLQHGKVGGKYDGICFETQYEPDGINHEGFSSAVLEAGQKYYHKTEYSFSVE